jgi:hypothetical protein
MGSPNRNMGSANRNMKGRIQIPSPNSSHTMDYTIQYVRSMSMVFRISNSSNMGYANLVL